MAQKYIVFLATCYVPKQPVSRNQFQKLHNLGISMKIICYSLSGKPVTAHLIMKRRQGDNERCLRA